jgi:hypothetical protein
LDILKKWRKLKIWNKFDMIGKDGGKDDWSR